MSLEDGRTTSINSIYSKEDDRKIKAYANPNQVYSCSYKLKATQKFEDHLVVLFIGSHFSA